MTRLVDRLARVMPSHGVLATEAGKRVALSIAALTGIAGSVAVVILGIGVAVWSATGLLDVAVLRSLVIGLLAGFAVVVLAFLTLPLIGRFTGIANDFRLLELSNPGSPLLRDLMTSAPGTYSHSIMTGSLAERAAHEIGANGLLARVGAYYHDVGKVVRPRFFVENQAGRNNPHDIASPSQSAFVITAHVREGAAIARASRLPDEVIDIIRQHHGTSLVAYFYEKALRGDAPVIEDDFRYEGELPDSREAALVMLADGAEAAARVVCDPTEARFRAMVRRIVDAKIEDGQLQDSDMSSEDLEKTIDVYAAMLASIYHNRVRYPEDIDIRRP